MGDNSEVFKNINKINSVNYPVLVPNLKGFYQALKCGVKEIAVFCAASEAFAKKNTNCTIEESLVRARDVINEALSYKIKIRG